MLIDAHVHLYPDADAGRRAKESYVIWEYGDDPGVSFDTADGTLAELGDRFGAAGFDRAVVLQLFDVEAARADALARRPPGLAAGREADMAAFLEAALVEAYIEANHWVVSAAADHPLLVPYVGIDPVLLPAPALVGHLEEMAALGARGVKLHPVAQGFAPDDERLDPVYEACCRLDLVVLSHSGPGHRHGASARPREFAPVLEKWPQLRLVLAHLGGAAFAESAELAADFPQVTFDLSEIVEWVGAPNAPGPDRLSAVIAEIGPQRIMLGSDFPWYEPARTADRVSALPGLGPEALDALLSGTAREVLRL